MFEREYRDLSFVPRWGIVRTIQNQSVAEHSFFVALYTSQIMGFMGAKEDLISTAIVYALNHDREECFMSDIPGPVKRSIRDFNKYTEFVEKETKNRFEPIEYPVHGYTDIVVKIADCLDEVLFLSSELKLGNKNVGAILLQSKNRLATNMSRLYNAIPDSLNLKFNKLETIVKEAINTELNEYSVLVKDS